MDLFKLALTIYIPVIFTLQWFINLFDEPIKRKICNILETPWVIWCLCLSIFSGFGTYYTCKYILYEQDKHIDETEAGFWYTSFLISKLPELFDTVFIVLRSKKLVALQWYHHWATLAICYYLLPYRCNQFIYFFFMNYFVHFFMYFYFAMYCYYGKRLHIFSIFINIIQTLQMLFAIFIGFYIYYNNIDGTKCLVIPTDIDNLFNVGMIMYTTYLILFVQLFFERKERLSDKKEK